MDDRERGHPEVSPWLSENVNATQNETYFVVRQRFIEFSFKQSTKMYVLIIVQLFLFIFKQKCSQQLLKCEDFILFFDMCDSKLNIFEFWTGGPNQRSNLRTSPSAMGNHKSHFALISDIS